MHRAKLKIKTYIDKLLERIADHVQQQLYKQPYIHGPRNRIKVGDGVKLANVLLNTRSGSIFIEDYVIFGHNVLLLTGIHDYSKKSPHRETLEDANRNIVVGRGAWICSNVTIIGPVKIGAESVIAAGSVVTKDVPDNTIVAGNPAKVVRKLTFSKSIEYDNSAAIQLLCYGRLNYPNENHRAAFRSYIQVSNLAFHLGSKNILEIGSGLSTVLWAKYAERTGAEVYTIDADLERLRLRVGNTDFDTLVKKHVKLIRGTTINADDLIDFYFHKPREAFGNVKTTDLEKYLDNFQSRNCPDLRWQEISRLAGRDEWLARDLVISEGKLVFSRQILDLFSMNQNFDDEVRFLQEIKERGETDVLESLISKGKIWDLVFFDSGELSSMIEWLILKEHIAVGGLAAFHDVFFPKSIKNFVVCASLMADPNWRVVLIDDSTRQGLLVAEKLR